MSISPSLEARINNIHSHVSPDQTATSEYQHQTSTAQYMVSIGEILASSVKSFEKAIQLFHYDFYISRFTNPNVSNQQYSSSRVEFKNPLLVIPNGVHTPILVNNLIKGILIEEIKISRLQNVGEVNEAGETILFKNCYLQEVLPKYDVLYLTFRFSEYNHNATSADQKGGAGGNNAVAYNMSTSEVG